MYIRYGFGILYVGGPMMEIRFVVVLKAITRSEAIYRVCGPLIRAPELGIQPSSYASPRRMLRIPF